MSKKCKQKIKLLMLLQRERIEEIKHDYDKKLKEKDDQIEKTEQHLLLVSNASYKITGNSIKNTNYKIDMLNQEIKEKDDQIKYLKNQLEYEINQQKKLINNKTCYQ